MAIRDLMNLKPRMPHLETLDLAKMTPTYLEDVDTLYIHLYGEARPAVSVEVAPNIFIRVDPVTSEVVGIQLECALSRLAAERPELITIARFAGASQRALNNARRREADDEKLALFSFFNRPPFTPAPA